MGSHHTPQRHVSEYIASLNQARGHQPMLSHHSTPRYLISARCACVCVYIFVPCALWLFLVCSSNSSSSTGVGTSVVSNTTILSLGPGTLNGNCHWPYANPPTCDMTFATYYGSSYTLFSILFAISAAVILCATYIHHARLGRALQQHWPAGLQGNTHHHTIPYHPQPSAPALPWRFCMFCVPT